MRENALQGSSETVSQLELITPRYAFPFACKGHNHITSLIRSRKPNLTNILMENYKISRVSHTSRYKPNNNYLEYHPAPTLDINSQPLRC